MPNPSAAVVRACSVCAPPASQVMRSARPLPAVAVSRSARMPLVALPLPAQVRGCAPAGGQGRLPGMVGSVGHAAALAPVGARLCSRAIAPVNFSQKPTLAQKFARGKLFAKVRLTFAQKFTGHQAAASAPTRAAHRHAPRPSLPAVPPHPRRAHAAGVRLWGARCARGRTGGLGWPRRPGGGTACVGVRCAPAGAPGRWPRPAGARCMPYSPVTPCGGAGCRLRRAAKGGRRRGVSSAWITAPPRWPTPQRRR